MSDLSKAFAGLKQAQEPERPGTQAKQPSPRLAPAPKRRARTGLYPADGTAKSCNRKYTAVKVFLRRDTHRAAGRKWQDEEAGDFSDLVERLLKKYLGA